MPTEGLNDAIGEAQGLCRYLRQPSLLIVHINEKDSRQEKIIVKFTWPPSI